MIDFSIHEKAIRDHCERWSSLVLSADGLPDEAAIAPVNSLYALLGKPAPRVIFCDSPFQGMLMVAALAKGTARAKMPGLDKKEELRKFYREHQVPAVGEMLLGNIEEDEHLWRAMWERLDLQVSEQVRSQLLADSLNEDAKPAKPIVEISIPGFAQKKTEPTETAWTSLVSTLATRERLLISQLHGVASAFFAGNKRFEEIRHNFEDDIRANRFGLDSMAPLRASIAAQPTSLIASLSGTAINQLTSGDLAERAMSLLTNPAALKNFSAAMKLDYDFAIRLARAMAEMSPAVSPWIPFYEYIADHVDGHPIGPSNLKFLKALSALSVVSPFVTLFAGLAFICRRPLVARRDESGRLHSEQGPALAFGDGFPCMFGMEHQCKSKSLMILNLSPRTES